MHFLKQQLTMLTHSQFMLYSLTNNAFPEQTDDNAHSLTVYALLSDQQCISWSNRWQCSLTHSSWSILHSLWQQIALTPSQSLFYFCLWAIISLPPSLFLVYSLTNNALPEATQTAPTREANTQVKANHSQPLSSIHNSSHPWSDLLSSKKCHSMQYH